MTSPTTGAPELGRLVKAATPSPWICYADLPSANPNWHIVTTANKLRVLANVHIEPGNAVDPANAALITLAPDLAAEVIRLTAKNARLREALTTIARYGVEPIGTIARAAIGADHV